MLSRKITPIKVISLAGWKDIKTIQYCIRKAGVDISGISDILSFMSQVKELII
jgi:integrase